MLNNQLRQQIKELAISEIPEEICGLILEKEGKIFIYPCSNISHHKENHFELNPFDYIYGSKLGKVIFYYHSQEHGDASELDKINSKIHNIKSIIYSWKEDKFFECGDSELDKYIGREFDIEKNNCYILLQDYFKNQLNINLNDIKLSDDWYEQNPNLILDNFKKEGGIKIDINDMKKNDVIFFSLIKSNPCHIGIYLGEDSFLHHPRGKYSIIEYLSSSWKNRIGFVVRHKNLF